MGLILHLGAAVKSYGTRWVVVLFAVVAVPLAVGAQEYEGDGKVEGKIVNAEGQGLGDAVITAVFAETGTGPEAEASEGDGDFEVEDLKPGMWTLTVSAPHLGYGGEIVDVEVLEDDTPELEIVLQPMQTLLDQGNATLQAENYAEALHNYERLLVALPDNATLHQPIALAYKGLGQHEQALEHFAALLQGWQNLPAGTLPPAPAVQIEIRIQAMSSAAQIADYPQMHAYLESIGEGGGAEQVVSGLVEISANTLMAAQESYQEAVSVLDVAIQRSPNAPLAYYYRGMSYVQLENDDAARADLSKFVELSPAENAQVRQAKDILEKLAPASESQQ